MGFNHPDSDKAGLVRARKDEDVVGDNTSAAFKEVVHRMYEILLEVFTLWRSQHLFRTYASPDKSSLHHHNNNKHRRLVLPNPFIHAIPRYVPVGE